MSETATSPGTDDAAAARRGELQRSATRQAWTVVLALTLIATLVIVEFAFSTSNDTQNVDGTTASSSRYVE